MEFAKARQNIDLSTDIRNSIVAVHPAVHGMLAKVNAAVMQHHATVTNGKVHVSIVLAQQTTETAAFGKRELIFVKAARLLGLYFGRSEPAKINLDVFGIEPFVVVSNLCFTCDETQMIEL